MTAPRPVSPLDALREWKCPSCGGSGWYAHKTHVGTAWQKTTRGTCKTCNGTGLHPTASAALDAAEAEKA